MLYFLRIFSESILEFLPHCRTVAQGLEPVETPVDIETFCIRFHIQLRNQCLAIRFNNRFRFFERLLFLRRIDQVGEFFFFQFPHGIFDDTLI